MFTPRRAFTLMEMLVIIMIIGILTGLLLPVVSSVRRNARAAECQNHLTACAQAMAGWLKDHEEIYPAKYVYKDAEYFVGPYGLLGEAGLGMQGDKTPLGQRPLNLYGSDVGIAKCPLDRGTRQYPSSDADSYDDNQGQMLMSEYQGCSYYYPARTEKEVSDNQWVLRDGMWMVGGHRSSQIEFPDRKLIFADAIVLPEFSGDNAVHHWHNASEPLVVNVAFADGHVQDVARKTSDRFTWPSGTKTYNYGQYFDGSNPGEAQKEIRALLVGRSDPANPQGPVLEASPYY